MALIKHVHLFIHASTHLSERRAQKIENNKKKISFFVPFFSRWAVAKGKTKKTFKQNRVSSRAAKKGSRVLSKNVFLYYMAIKKYFFCVSTKKNEIILVNLSLWLPVRQYSKRVSWNSFSFHPRCFFFCFPQHKIFIIQKIFFLRLFKNRKPRCSPLFIGLLLLVIISIFISLTLNLYWSTTAHSLKDSTKFLVRNCTFIQLLRHKLFFDLNFLFHAIFFLVYFFLYSFIVLFIQKFIPFFLLSFFISSIFLLLLFNIFSFSAFKNSKEMHRYGSFFHFFTFLLVKKRLKLEFFIPLCTPFALCALWCISR